MFAHVTARHSIQPLTPVDTTCPTLAPCRQTHSLFASHFSTHTFHTHILFALTLSHPFPHVSQDVKFGAANLPAMNFMGGGAKNGQEWLDFLGTVKDKRVPPVGSPFQLNFNPAAAQQPGGGGDSGGGDVPGVRPVPPEITPAQEKLPSCGDPLFLCSCADCPPAPGCQAVSGFGLVLPCV